MAGRGDASLARLDVGGVLRDAWALFHRDRDLLLRVAGAFTFLPLLARWLLVPPPPVREGVGDDDAAAMAWFDSLGTWAGAHGGWYLLAYAIGCVGTAALYACYLDRSRPAVGEALRLGVTRLPRFLLAMAMIAVPAGAGMLLLFLPGFYVLGRTMLAGPALMVEGLSALGAIRRSLWLTRGAGLPLTVLVAIPALVGTLAAHPFVRLDGWMRGRGAINPVALGIVDAGASLVGMATGLATLLIAVAAYARLNRA